MRELKKKKKKVWNYPTHMIRYVEDVSLDIHSNKPQL